MSAVGVVRIAFARTGLALVSTIFSKLLAPSGDEQIKMLEDDLPHLPSQTWRAIVFKFLRNIETVWMQPILAFRVSFHRVHVNRLTPFVRIEMDPPALHI